MWEADQVQEFRKSRKFCQIVYQGFKLNQCSFYLMTQCYIFILEDNMGDGVVIGQDNNDLEESNEESSEGDEDGNDDDVNGEEFELQEEYNSDDEDSDVIQMAEGLDTDLERLDRAREAEKQKRRDAEKARRARAARHSVGFIDEETDEFNVTFNAGNVNSSNDAPARPRGGAS